MHAQMKRCLPPMVTSAAFKRRRPSKPRECSAYAPAALLLNSFFNGFYRP